MVVEGIEDKTTAKEKSTITLVSEDGKQFEINVEAAKASTHLLHFMEGGDPSMPMPLPKVKSHVLEKIIEYLEYYKNRKPKEIPKPLPNLPFTHLVDEWDAKFISLEHRLIFELMIGANYLDIPGLLDLCGAKFAAEIRNKTVEEIRKIFGIKNDFTPEEEAQIREENRWCDPTEAASFLPYSSSYAWSGVENLVVVTMMQPGASRWQSGVTPNSLEKDWGVLLIHDAGHNNIPKGYRGYLYHADRTAVVDSNAPERVRSNDITSTTSDSRSISSGRRSAFNLYFVDQQGFTCRLTKVVEPHFLLRIKDTFAGLTIESLDTLIFHSQSIVESYISNKFPSAVIRTSIEYRVDTSVPANYLLNNGNVGAYKKHPFIRLGFENFEDQRSIRFDLLKLVRENADAEQKAIRLIAQDHTLDMFGRPTSSQHYLASTRSNPLVLIADLLEGDIDDMAMFFIDHNIRCGLWYDIKMVGVEDESDTIDYELIPSDTDIQKIAPPLNVCAWDIETHKAPLRFPDVNEDAIMCISYMTHNGGFLLVNLEYFSQEIEDFDYQPNPEFGGEFKVFNFETEKDLITFFLYHIQQCVKPHVMVTYNGDSFDFPYLNGRASVGYEFVLKIVLVQKLGISIYSVWGFRAMETGPNQGKRQVVEYTSHFVIHIDALKWVERDSYLPCGSRGLKAVTRAKLRYEPREVDPEQMVMYCKTRPQTMAEYSVSDAVATYNIYMRYVHRFTLALSSIIPMKPDDILRRGSGTLCEHLLMAQAWRNNVCIPNKMSTQEERWFDDKWLLHSETYVGGQVEQLKAGIFRDDIPEKFYMDSKIIDRLLDALDDTYEVWLKHEGNPNQDMNIIDSNWPDIRETILQKFKFYKAAQEIVTEPMIYHLDVGAMYPNIILSQRLQPYAIVNDENCRNCVWNDDGNNCRRPLSWTWKAERYTLDKSHTLGVEEQLRVETFNILDPYTGQSVRKRWEALTAVEKREIKSGRLKLLSAKLNRNKFKVPLEQQKQSIVCQRAASFYVDTVRDFRDRRIVYKTEKKKSEKKLLNAEPGLRAQYGNEVAMFDSLQLAHKCILNSFYGYVMRRGARWFSLEMAAVVTHMGACVIKEAKEVCAGVGIPLELDTDGVWTLLPKGFPDKFDIELTVSNPNLHTVTKSFSFPCWMLNAIIENKWINRQFHTVDELTGSYKVSAENSVLFEIDGPYKAMFLPASEKKDQQLKKRYAVYDFDGKMVEVKGFEIKRRGELQILKLFQEDAFPEFMSGTTRKEIYESVAAIADRWMKFLRSEGRPMQNHPTEILELLVESTTLSKAANESGSYKSMGITTAQRLCDLLNDTSYITRGGVRAAYVMSKIPLDEPRTARAFPLCVFEENDTNRDAWIKKWTRNLYNPSDSSQNNVLRSQTSESFVGLKSLGMILSELLDWQYYRERVTATIQKIVVVPCITQGIINPCSVDAPQWLKNRTDSSQGLQSQLKDWMNEFNTINSDTINKLVDIPDPLGLPDISADKENVIDSNVKNFNGPSSIVDQLRNEWKKYRLALSSQTNFQWLSKRLTCHSTFCDDKVLTLVDLVEHITSNTSFLYGVLADSHFLNYYRVNVNESKVLLLQWMPDLEFAETLSVHMPSVLTPLSVFKDRLVTMPQSNVRKRATQIRIPHDAFRLIQHRMLDLSAFKKSTDVVQHCRKPEAFWGISSDRTDHVLAENGISVHLAFSESRQLSLTPASRWERSRLKDCCLIYDFFLAIGSDSADISQTVRIKVMIDSVVNPSLVLLGANGTRSCNLTLINSRLTILKDSLRKILTRQNNGQILPLYFKICSSLASDTSCWSLKDLFHDYFRQNVVLSTDCLVDRAINLVGIQPVYHSLFETIGTEYLPESFDIHIPVIKVLIPPQKEDALGIDSKLFDPIIPFLDKSLSEFKGLLNAQNIDSINDEYSMCLGVRIRKLLSTNEQIYGNSIGIRIDFHHAIIRESIKTASTVLPTCTDLGPCSPSALIADADVYLGSTIGTICHDGTQGKKVAMLIPHYNQIVPKISQRITTRKRIVYLRFKRSTISHSLSNLLKLAEKFKLNLGGWLYISRQVSMATYVTKEQGEDEAILAELGHSDLLLQVCASICTDMFQLALQIFSKISSEPFLKDSPWALERILDPSSSLFIPEIARSLLHYWNRFMLKMIHEEIISLGEYQHQKYDPISIWSQGALITVTNIDGSKNKLPLARIITNIMHGNILKDLVEPSQSSEFAMGLQLDDRNALFITNEREIGHIHLPSLDPIPGTLAELLEARFIQLLLEPCGLDERTKDEFLRHKWRTSVSTVISKAMERSRNGFGQSSCVLGVLDSSLREIPFSQAATNMLIQATQNDEIFRNWSAEDRHAWMTNLDCEDEDNCNQVYGLAVTVILPNIFCSKCGHNDNLDLSNIDPDQKGQIFCPRCKQSYSEDIIESRLVTLVETHMAALQSREIQCIRCKSPRRLRCQRYCQCGGSYKFCTHMPDTKLLMETMKSLTSSADMPWLEAVVNDLWCVA